MSLLDKLLKAPPYKHTVKPGYYFSPMFGLFIIYNDFDVETFDHFPTRGQTEKDNHWHISHNFKAQWYIYDHGTENMRADTDFLGEL